MVRQLTVQLIMWGPSTHTSHLSSFVRTCFAYKAVVKFGTAAKYGVEHS